MGAFQALASARALQQSEGSQTKVEVQKDGGHPVWGPVVRARAAAMKADREARAASTSTSDLEELQRGLVHEVSVEARENKPLKGVAVPRSLPRSVNDRIDTMQGQLGDDLRKARQEGRIRFSWEGGRGRWVVDGLKAPASVAKSEGGHFMPSMFPNTARRQRERGGRV